MVSFILSFPTCHFTDLVTSSFSFSMPRHENFMNLLSAFSWKKYENHMKEVYRLHSFCLWQANEISLLCVWINDSLVHMAKCCVPNKTSWLYLYHIENTGSYPNKTSSQKFLYVSVQNVFVNLMYKFSERNQTLAMIIVFSNKY